jgi:hypothetical protein
VRRNRSRLLLVSAGSAALAIGVAGAARADLGDDAARVTKQWEIRGATVVRAPAIFVEHGRPRAIALPAVKGECISVAALGVRVADVGIATEPAFTASLNRSDPARPVLRPEEGRSKSSGGVATMTRCGVAKADLARVVVDISAGRGAIEIIVAGSAARQR